MSLVLRDVGHSYADVDAVTDANLDVAAGEIVCLFGASGCGKTTILRLVAGLERLQTGTIELDGVRLSGEGVEVPAERRPTGYVFQDYVLFPHLTAIDNICFGLMSLPPAERRSYAVKAMRLANLEGLESRFPHELSGGQQQRVALVRALVRRPRAMLLDEPFASIDSVSRKRLRQDIRRLLKEYNAATILVTHDPEEALAIGDRIAVMKLGKIVETASPKNLYQNPATPEGASLFAGAQRIDGECRGGVVRTNFGDIPAPKMTDGPVMVVALAGAVTARRRNTSTTGAVSCGSRFVGPGWSVEAQCSESTVFWAASSENIGKGEPIDILLDPAFVRLFAAVS